MVKIVFGFLASVRVFCSGSCSGGGVEKLWKSLRESMWGTHEKVSTLLRDCSGYVIKTWKSEWNCGKCGKFYRGFYTGKLPLLNSRISTVSTESITTITNYLIERSS